MNLVLGKAPGFHPKSLRLRIFKNKNHTFPLGQTVAVHQPRLSSLWSSGQFELQGLFSDLNRILRPLRILLGNNFLFLAGMQKCAEEDNWQNGNNSHHK